MYRHETLIAVQPVEAKATASTRASALRPCVSERAETATPGSAGWRR
jgi:hypothetical protein